MGRTAGDPLERYLTKIDVRSPDECWEWTAARFDKGYGAFRLGEKQVKAHRFGYEAQIGPIPDGVYVLHHCDNPPCQNPSHWFLGTHRDNAVDREQKGRGAGAANFHGLKFAHEGEHNAMAKLTEDQVREIRTRVATGETQTAVAAEFGVTQPMVSMIVNRKFWTHVD